MLALYSYLVALWSLIPAADAKKVGACFENIALQLLDLHLIASSDQQPVIANGAQQSWLASWYYIEFFSRIRKES